MNDAPADQPTRNRNRNRAALVLSAALLVGATHVATRLATDTGEKIALASTEYVVEADSGLRLIARVDSGAAFCSLHCGPGDLEIDDEQPNPNQNIGRSARVRVTNHNGEQRWVATRIASYVAIRSAMGGSARYRVPLRLRCRGVEKKVLVTLADRTRVRYRVLLGRDFLQDNFVVDVALAGPQLDGNPWDLAP